MIQLAMAEATKISGFRQVVLGHVSKFIPRHTGQVHARVLTEWGEVSRRATERALSFLYRLGLVVRTGDGYLRARPER